MATNKSPFTFNLEEIYLQKMKAIAKPKTRRLSNLLEHLCRIKIQNYEKENGEITIETE